MASVRPCITNDSLRHGKCAVPVHQYPSKCGWRDVGVVGDYRAFDLFAAAKARFMNLEGAFFFCDECTN